MYNSKDKKQLEQKLKLTRRKIKRFWKTAPRTPFDEINWDVVTEQEYRKLDDLRVLEQRLLEQINKLERNSFKIAL